MVYRIYVEKKQAFNESAQSLFSELKNILGVKNLTSLRLINRYDAENLDKELFDYAVNTVFSEPQVDNAYEELSLDGATVFAVEYLPGQFDQRADSASQCITLIAQIEKPLIRSAKVYALYGDLTQDEIDAVKKYVINPVEAREASLDKPETLKIEYGVPTSVATLDGFIDLDEQGLANFVKEYGLAMDNGDIKFCQDYFKKENRNPTVTEIRMIDTYWSDHCRHTTFLTTIDKVEFLDETVQKTYEEYLADRKALNRTKPINLMDIATLATRVLKKAGKLDRLDESEEINACTVKITVDVNGEDQQWLLLFKNETHNHPTEIEPFGGAATCIGGAIRDPLSGRSYVYSAMRVTGAGNPLVPVKDTLKGKLPQRKIVTTAANGYSSYGNQIGLATGLVDEIYHDGYVAKRMEIGAVVAAAPAENVRRERPCAGDIIVLLGGKTGRDGCGGATGSSKSHTLSSLTSCGAEVQKGNAPEERKLQRLFRNGEATRLIKRCNDFGAGGVSVAIGELADGLKINLNAVPKKYDGLDGTELAISESQERMAVVVEAKDAEKFIDLASKENLEATIVAVVTEEARLVMEWNGVKICDIDREFLNSNGAEKHVTVKAEKGKCYKKEVKGGFRENYTALAGDLNVCSKRGLVERFDSTIGAGTVLMPYGGKYQKTPIQAMVNKVSVEKGETKTCSVMAYGYNPFITENNQYNGAYLAVIESVTKLMATGADFKEVYLTFQEYFEKLGKDASRWGKPFSALLGAYKAQKDLGIASIGGKDSMSGSFESLDVPPTLVSFAVTTTKVDKIVTPEFKKANSKVILVKPEYDENGLPVPSSLLACYKTVNDLNANGKILAGYSVGYGGIAECVLKMCLGNGLGFKYADDISIEEMFSYLYGAMVLEVTDDTDGVVIGSTQAKASIDYKEESICLAELDKTYSEKLEEVFPVKASGKTGDIENISFISTEDTVLEKRLKLRRLENFVEEEKTLTNKLFFMEHDQFILEEKEKDIRRAIKAGENLEEQLLENDKDQYNLFLKYKPIREKRDGLREKIKELSGGLSVEDAKEKLQEELSVVTDAPFVRVAQPKVLIPVFPGTNCEFDTAKVFEGAGAKADIFVVNNLSADAVKRSVEEFAKKIKESQIVFIPGGFSGGDEPDGSGKFITAFLRNAEIKKAVTELLDNRDGLMGGICNGFQALVKLGLVPYGKIIDTDANCPTLTFNDIGRHQSRLVNVRVASNKSPWFKNCKVGDIYTVAISHGEGKFVANDDVLASLIANGQVATQYVDLSGNATYDIDFNPNGSYLAIEGITSPDGRVFGKMGHSERIGYGLYKNVYGKYDMGLFKSAVEYFK